MSRLIGLGKWLVSAALVVLVAGQVSAAPTLIADATNGRQVTIFRNVSGGTTTSGTAHILQDSTSDGNVLVGTDFGQESSLGLDVTTTTSADSGRFVGCQVDDSCVDDALCRVVTWGPAICRWAGATDNTNTKMATVGTTTVAGMLGSGTLAGLTMSTTLSPGHTSDVEQNGANDNELRWIWVSPDNN